MDNRSKPPVSRKPEVVRARILDAAQAEFMAEGYAGASTNRILERFGGSKPTMFRHFSTKRAMYEAVVTRIASRWAERINLSDSAGAGPKDWLIAFAIDAVRWILSEENIFLGRMAVLEAGSTTKAAELYRTHASVPIEAALADKLEQWTRQGLLASLDPARDAISFLDLTLAGPVSRRLYGAEGPLSDTTVASNVAHAVSLFLDGRRPR